MFDNVRPGLFGGSMKFDLRADSTPAGILLSSSIIIYSVEAGGNIDGDANAVVEAALQCFFSYCESFE